MQATRQRGLDIDQVLGLIQAGGRLAEQLTGFEARPEQQAMMRGVLEAYRDESIALIEAGTGIGKSVAYLVPAILWAAKFGERTVISTNTITLQEQLIEKDIPLVLKALGVEVKASLVKGMGNYLCLRKYDEALFQMPMLPKEEADELARMEPWCEKTADGTLSELSFVPSYATWERTGAETDTCNGRKCPAYQQCFFWNARRKAQDAQILVVNHHLLFSDLAKRAEDNNYTDTAVLPTYQHLIIDEAHNIEDIATNYFASRVGHWEMLRLLNRLCAEKHGKLTFLKKQLSDLAAKTKGNLPEAFREVHYRLELDLPGQRHELEQQFGELFQNLTEFVYRLKDPEDGEAQNPGESRIRLVPKVVQHPDWLGEIQPAVKKVVATGLGFCAALQGLEQNITQIKNSKFDEQTAGLRHEIGALTSRLIGMTDTLQSITQSSCKPDHVRWMETYPYRGIQNVNLIDAQLDLSKLLVDYLFSKFSSTVLCSATLTTNHDFGFFRKQLGLEPDSVGGKAVRQQIHDSPFNYREQALLAVPTDTPEPSHPQFMKAAIDRIWETVVASHGNALVLFTSYQMLKACHAALQERFRQRRYPLLRQGEENRKTLLQKLRSQDHSVLFATYSFWEGVDIAGDALRCVIIVKLPFKVPTEPVLAGRAEAIIATGGSPFTELAMPLAIVKFKQGFGRLIRNGSDRGCIVCLDTRLITKAYGKLFLNSLPDCGRVFDTSDIVLERMKDFYRKTQHLVRRSNP